MASTDHTGRQEGDFQPSRSGERGHSLHREVVTQDMLEELHWRKAEMRRCDELRDRIKDMIRNGAEVEPGRLRAEIKSVEIRRFSVHSLGCILGAEVVENLRSRIQPVIQENLFVTAAAVRPEDQRLMRAAPPVSRERRPEAPESLPMSGGEEFIRRYGGERRRGSR